MADCIDDSCDLIDKSNASNATKFQRIALNGSMVVGDRYNDGDADNPSHVSTHSEYYFFPFHPFFHFIFIVCVCVCVVQVY